MSDSIRLGPDLQESPSSLTVRSPQCTVEDCCSCLLSTLEFASDPTERRTTSRRQLCRQEIIPSHFLFITILNIWHHFSKALSDWMMVYFNAKIAGCIRRYIMRRNFLAYAVEFTTYWPLTDATRQSSTFLPIAGHCTVYSVQLRFSDITDWSSLYLL